VLVPGRVCVYGHVTGSHLDCLGSTDTIGSSDPRWFWQYWPNGTVIDYDYEVGSTGSVGPDGSWHLYAIQPNTANGWDFVLDGKIVRSLSNSHWTTSRQSVYALAEEITTAPSASGSLGPVEFRNLSYLKEDGWHQVTSLTATVGCAVLNPNCDHPNIKLPYGVTLAGPNDFKAGTGQQLRKNNDLLWTTPQQTTTTAQTVSTSATQLTTTAASASMTTLGLSVIAIPLIVIIGLIVFVVRRRKSKRTGGTATEGLVTPVSTAEGTAFCTHCGNRVPVTARFCESCGSKQN
jgi:hypothetical protein